VIRLSNSPVYPGAVDGTRPTPTEVAGGGSSPSALMKGLHYYG
jgi:hypothetical protein